MSASPLIKIMVAGAVCLLLSGCGGSGSERPDAGHDADGADAGVDGHADADGGVDADGGADADGIVDADGGEDSDGGADGGGGCSSAIVANGGFELAPGADDDRPPYWYVGFSDEPLPGSAGAWSLDADTKAEGDRSLRLEPTGELYVTQILHLSSALLEGRTVRVSAQVRHEGLDQPPVILAVALNPDILEPDPVFGPGIAGSTIVQADAEQGVWKEVSGELVASAPASLVFVYLGAESAGGRAWFDDVRAEAEPWAPGPGPDPAQVDIPVAERSFDLGLTAEGPMDLSELGRDCLITTAAEVADVLDVFCAVQWCKLDRDDCDLNPDHALDLALAEQARQAGLALALTFDFTHGSFEQADSIGDLNPLPGGGSPGTLLDPDVRAALKEEALWLFDQMRPEYVLFGIEVNIMYEKHPDWWDAYVALEGEVYDAIKAIEPATHVTAYHTIDWSVTPQGGLRPAAAAAWQQLLPKIDSIAYSVYPHSNLPGVFLDDVPAGYFARPRDIAPDLPILVPEFGMAGGGDSGFSNQEQANWLRRMISDFAAASPAGLFWFQLYDRPYYGAPAWAQQLFERMGLLDLTGTPKESFVIWHKLHAL